MTYDHDDTLHAIFNTINGTSWIVSKFIDFDLKNGSSKLAGHVSRL